MYDWYCSTGTKFADAYQISLPGFADRLLLPCPVNNNWAVVGHADKYLAPAAIARTSSTENRLEIELTKSGPVVIWSGTGEPKSTDGVRRAGLGNGFWRFDLPVGQRNRRIAFTRPPVSRKPEGQKPNEKVGPAPSRPTTRVNQNA